jgi:hypothetical protein
MTPKMRPIGEWDERRELPEAVGKGLEEVGGIVGFTKYFVAYSIPRFI